jgi:hypothetical protein
VAGTVTIKRQGDTSPNPTTWSADAGTPIPSGYEVVASTPVVDTASSSGLADTLYDLLGQAGSYYANTVAPSLTSGTQDFIDYMSPAPLDPYVEGLAQHIVPQTPTGAGIALGATALGGPLGMAAKGVINPAVTRILASAAGGAIGGAADQRPVPGTPGVPPPSRAAQGAFEGLLAGGAGEALAYPASVAGRALYQQGIDERAVGQAVGQISPPLSGLTTSNELRSTLTGAAGQENLRDSLRATLDEILFRVGVGPIRSPSMAAHTGQNPEHYFRFEELANLIASLRPGTHSLKSGTAKEGLSAAEMRALRSGAVDDVTTGLRDLDRPRVGGEDSPSASLYSQMNDEYGAGQALQRLFNKKDVFDPVTGKLDMSKLQVAMKANRRELEMVLGPERYALLEQAVGRGQPIGRVDRYDREMPSVFTLPPMPLPSYYAGNAFGVPAAPFTIGTSQLLENLAQSGQTVSIRNPFTLQ